MNNNLTFNQEFDKYLNYLSLNLKPTTVLSVERNFRLHILPYIKNIEIVKFNQEDYFNWQNKLKNKGFSYNFEQNIQIMFKRFFDYLERTYNIKNYPKIYGKFKNFKETKIEELNVWSLSEYKQFIKNVDDIVYHALFNLLFFTGLRKGEALALKFSDLSNNIISISKTLTQEHFNGKRIELSPKTKKSIRKIQIDFKLKKELIKLRKYYITNFKEFNENFYIFGGNKAIALTTLKRKKDFYCDKAKVKRIRIHDFRHSHATILYHQRISAKLIQSRLGHSDVTTTLNTYVHIDSKDKKRVLNKLNFIRLLF